MNLGIRCAFLLSLAALTPSTLAAGLVFNFTLGPGVTAGDRVYDGFTQAASRWSSIFTDDVAVNLTIGFYSLGPGILGSTTATTYYGADAAVKGALAADAKSGSDATAVAHLQPAGSNAFVIDHTSECGNCTSVYLSNSGTKADNRYLSVTGAQARALGLLPATDNVSDGTIAFSSDFAFDFDPSNGIDSGSYDFVGVATHEIGHLLGFASSVDDYDYCGVTLNCATANSALSENQDAPTVLDLFRYSTDSGFGTRMDLSADSRNKYFSIDGGATLGAQFATGVNFGDGRQASHWKDSLGLGILDPTAATGELLAISRNDITALDVIGWDVAPEPAAWSLFATGIGMIAWRVRRRKASGAE
jgi:hypothetical protein